MAGSSSPHPRALHSPLPSPSPSPSPAFSDPSRSTATPSPSGWHFPGPSSKYHQRERPRPTHSRTASTYTPRGPVLSTERRAHQRAQSYAAHTASPFPAVPTPPASECGRSPLGRFPSYTSTMAKGSGPAAPSTPAKSTAGRRRSSLLQDSPFSDYFTDSAPSVDEHRMPASETQKLLVRMNKLQSQLMRGGNEVEVVNIIAKKLGEIEGEVEALHSQTRVPAETEENDLFNDDEKVVTPSRPGSRSAQSLSIHMESSLDEAEETSTPDWAQIKQNKLLADAQATLQSLTTAQEELKFRYRELLQINEENAVLMEEKETELLKLRSENETLKSDLGFDHSELLFLELQMRGLELDSNETNNIRTERLQKVLESWREDWRDVEARFKKRRAANGVSNPRKRDSQVEADLQQPHDPSEWKVEVCKQGNRRVGSLTLRRVSAEPEPEAPPSAGEAPGYCPASTQTQTPPSPSTRSSASQTHTLHTYASSSTQTDPPILPPEAFSSPVLERTRTDLESYYNDCAITTSPPSIIEAEAQARSVDVGELPQLQRGLRKQDQKLARREQKRTALRELWAGLSDLAGLGGEESD